MGDTHENHGAVGQMPRVERRRKGYIIHTKEGRKHVREDGGIPIGLATDWADRSPLLYDLIANSGGTPSAS